MIDQKRKKRVLFHSDFALAKTGFGRVMKTLLSHLYKSEKYEVHHLCCGVRDGAGELSVTPWKSHGAVTSDPRKLEMASQDPGLGRSIAYGSEKIDDVILEIKPDVYIGTQDFWGLDYTIDKPWFDKITSCIWTTLDSLPLLPSAVEKAQKIKNYWVWSNFAEKEMHRLGHKQVKTVHGPIESKFFYKLEKEERRQLRLKNNLPEDSVIIGFVFRNQLRKLVPNLMEGYKLWKNKHPEIKNTYLLLHTSFSEGWNIKSQAAQHGIDTKEILTTYICHKCGEYEVKSFDDRQEKFEKNEDGSLKLNPDGSNIETPLSAEGKDCKICGGKNCQSTTNVGFGVTEKQLNEVYNFMDVYVHPFTSGGQEIPIQEAKLTELITLVTNYSCGEECCEPEAHSLPLSWNKYLEHGTEFIKASTCPRSISDQLDVFLNMSDQQRADFGKKARNWALEKFSIQSVGREIENFLDLAPFKEEDDFHFEETNKESPNPSAEVDINLPDNEWVMALYANILDRKNVDRYDEGFLYWIKELNKKTDRGQIELYFRNVAANTIQEKARRENSISIESVLEKNNKKRLLYVMPQSLGDCFLSTAIFPSLREMYNEEEWDFYVASNPEFRNIFDGNKNITKWIPYAREMDNQLIMEGIGDHGGWFDICFNPYFSTQRLIDYVHNGKNKLLM
jgi:glycosyltransferase involved in cell wall biosynthesis